VERPRVLDGRRWRAALLAAAFVIVPAPGSAEREHFQLKLGVTYDQGDFGTSQTSRTLFLPATFRYLGDRFDVSATSGWVYLDAPSDVSLVDGTPTRTNGARGGRRTTSGVVDTVLRGRYFAVDDPGPGAWPPALAPFVKLKLPTADEDENLGTGEVDGGFGLEWDKSFWRITIFGDAGYTFMGDPPGQDFRDRPAASVGVAFRVSDVLALSGLLDWRRALVSGNDDPVELVGVATYKLDPAVSLSPHVFVGLTEGSPDVGLGVELSYRFGRW
jgi:hypothetical protein